MKIFGVIVHRWDNQSSDYIMDHVLTFQDEAQRNERAHDLRRKGIWNLETFESETELAPWEPKPYDPHFGDARICECGHPYYRHFDTYEDMAPVGCKYCHHDQCEEFKEKEDTK